MGQRLSAAWDSVDDAGSIPLSPAARLDLIEQKMRRLTTMLEGFGPSDQPSSCAGAIRLVTAKQLYRERRLRDQYLTGELFAEPAWDMLLDLYIAYYQNADIGVSSLCIAACVPGTTALRWIKTMQDADIFERKYDPLDRRRIYIRLTERARTAMDHYFDRLIENRQAPSNQ